MTAAPAAPTTQWGVRFAASVDRETHVTPCAREDVACRFLRGLLFSGNGDAELVTRPDAQADWVPVATAVQVENLWSRQSTAEQASNTSPAA